MGEKKILKVILIIVLVFTVGVGGYYFYGLYKLNELSSMTFKEMLTYTTKDNEDAVLTVGIIQNDKMTFELYGKNGIILSPEEHIYEIGSITKTFTSALLCEAIKEGRIDLDDFIDKYINLPKKDYYPTYHQIIGFQLLSWVLKF